MAVLNRFPQHADLPAVVYRAFDAHGELLYIGCTIHFERRRKEHERKLWGHRIARWETVEYECHHDALLAEEEAIKAEQPVFNAMYNGAGLTGWNDERRAAETCLHGHPWAENARINSQGIRVCRTCYREAGRRHDAKRRSKASA